VDLAVEVVPGEHHILVEFKEKADDSAFVAAEIVRNFILYLMARRHGPPELIERRPVLQARKVDLQVWAPVEYYEGRDWTCLERNLFEGLSQWAVEGWESGGVDASRSASVSYPTTPPSTDTSRRARHQVPTPAVPVPLILHGLCNVL
jgi:hypothetical protein